MVDIASLVRDPSLRFQIWEYVNQQDEILRAYINFGPYSARSGLGLVLM